MEIGVTSPKQHKVTAKVLLDFPDAIAAVANGNKIHKLEWADKDYYGVVEDGKLQLHKPDGKFYHWVISDGDLEGKDWITL